MDDAEHDDAKKSIYGSVTETTYTETPLTPHSKRSSASSVDDSTIENEEETEQAEDDFQEREDDERTFPPLTDHTDIDDQTRTNYGETKKQKYVRWTRLCILSKYFTAFACFLVILSTLFFVIGVSRNTPSWVQALDLCVTFVYAVEIVARIYVIRDFWTSWGNRIDCLVMVGCLLEIILTFTIPLSSDVGLGILIFRFCIRLFRSFQLLRHQREYVGMNRATEDQIDFENFDPTVPHQSYVELSEEKAKE